MIDYVILGGEKRPVKFGMNALRKFTTFAKIKLSELDTALADIDLDRAILLIYCGLEDGARKDGKDFGFAVDDVADWLDEDGKLDEVMAVIMQHQPEPGGAKAVATPP